MGLHRERLQILDPTLSLDNRSMIEIIFPAASPRLAEEATSKSAPCVLESGTIE